MQKEISGITINPPSIPEIDGVSLPRRSCLLGSFTALIVGKPRSGKTHLLKEMLRNKDLYYGKFDYVYVLSPSMISELELEQDINYISTFSLDWINEKINEIRDGILKDKIYVGQKGQKVNVLFIVDDMIASIKASQNDPRLDDFVFNRRHKFTDINGKDHGTVSIFFTTQKYSKFPNNIRSNIDALFFFKLAKNDYQKIKEEHMMITNKILDSTIEQSFSCSDDQDRTNFNFIYMNLQRGSIHLNFDKLMF